MGFLNKAESIVFADKYVNHAKKIYIAYLPECLKDFTGTVTIMVNDRPWTIRFTTSDPFAIAKEQRCVLIPTYTASELWVSYSEECGLWDVLRQLKFEYDYDHYDENILLKYEKIIMRNPMDDLVCVVDRHEEKKAEPPKEKLKLADLPVVSDMKYNVKTSDGCKITMGAVVLKKSQDNYDHEYALVCPIIPSMISMVKCTIPIETDLGLVNVYLGGLATRTYRSQFLEVCTNETSEFHKCDRADVFAGMVIAREVLSHLVFKSCNGEKLTYTYKGHESTVECKSYRQKQLVYYEF